MVLKLWLGGGTQSLEKFLLRDLFLLLKSVG